MPNTVNKQIKLSIYSALLYRMLLPFAAFFLCRLFFYLYNIDYYPGIPFSRVLIIFLGGLRFDLTALLYLNTLYLLLQVLPLKIRHHQFYQRISFWAYIVPNSVGIIMNLADTVYYQITLKRSTAAIFDQFAHEVNLPGLVFKFLIEFWYFDVIAIILVTLIVVAYKRVNVRKTPTDNIWVYTIGQTLVMALMVYLTVVGMRSGFKHSTRPITLSNASAYIEKPNQRAIVLNTPFAIFRTLERDYLVEKKYFSTQNEQEKVYSALHKAQGDRISTKKNVVVFIMESFGTEHIGALNKNVEGYKGFTPFLDSLIEHSYTFKHSYANGRKSISGMPSVLSSIPSLVSPFIISHYSGNEISSIASSLKGEGYYTAFFHGAANGSMGFDAFANQAGYDDYFGKNEFNNDDHYDGIWGIWDEEFFQFFNQEMNKMKQPFHTALFSVSSHHPFVLPKKHKEKFPEGELKIHKNIAYTDYSLRRFFDEAKKTNWYKNTLFVFSADHASTYSNIPKYKTSLGVFTVPVIFFEPSNPEMVGFDETTIVQQIDIMPTILRTLDYPSPFLAFGTDIFNVETEHFAINYLGDYYQFIMNGHMIQFNGKKSISLYDIENDPSMKENLLGQKPEIQEKLELKLKAIIQEYNRRLIRNEMIVR